MCIVHPSSVEDSTAKPILSGRFVIEPLEHQWGAPVCIEDVACRDPSIGGCCCGSVCLEDGDINTCLLQYILKPSGYRKAYTEIAQRVLHFYLFMRCMFKVNHHTTQADSLSKQGVIGLGGYLSP